MFLRSPQILQKKKQTCLTELLLEMNRIGLSLRQACQYAEGGEEPLNKTVNGNETWVHHYHHESKCISMQWKHPSSYCAKIFKITPSAGKVMLTGLWESQGVLLTNFRRKGDNEC